MDCKFCKIFVVFCNEVVIRIDDDEDKEIFYLNENNEEIVGKDVKLVG